MENRSAALTQMPVARMDTCLSGLFMPCGGVAVCMGEDRSEHPPARLRHELLILDVVYYRLRIEPRSFQSACNFSAAEFLSPLGKHEAFLRNAAV